MIILLAAILFWLAVAALAVVAVMPLGSAIDRLLNGEERPVRDECDARLKLVPTTRRR